MIFVFPNAGAIAEHVSDILIEKIASNPEVVLGLATGGTMEPVYSSFIQKAIKQQLDVSRLTSFNLDEYLGLHPSHHQSYSWYMHHHLFQHLPFNLKNCHVPSGIVDDPNNYCNSYSDAIQKAGGIELQLLGVGSNGHIGFNEPGTAFDSTCHVVELSPQTRIDNSRFFESGELVPDRALTMGMQDIMQAREIILIATGRQK